MTYNLTRRVIMDNQNNNQDNNQQYNQGNNQQYTPDYNNQQYNQGYNNQQYNQGYNNQQYNQGYNNQQYNQGYNQQQYNQNYNQQQYNQAPYGDLNELREEKSVATCVILSIVTCGIYTWFWMYSMIKKLKMLSGETDDMIGEYLLLMLVPYYNIYWVYTRSKKLTEAAARYGIQVTDNSVLYMILNIFGLQIVSYAMMQNDLNNVGKRI